MGENSQETEKVTETTETTVDRPTLSDPKEDHRVEVEPPTVTQTKETVTETSSDDSES